MSDRQGSLRRMVARVAVLLAVVLPAAPTSADVPRPSRGAERQLAYAALAMDPIGDFYRVRINSARTRRCRYPAPERWRCPVYIKVRRRHQDWRRCIARVLVSPKWWHYSIERSRCRLDWLPNPISEDQVGGNEKRPSRKAGAFLSHIPDGRDEPDCGRLAGSGMRLAPARTLFLA